MRKQIALLCAVVLFAIAAPLLAQQFQKKFLTINTDGGKLTDVVTKYSMDWKVVLACNPDRIRMELSGTNEGWLVVQSGQLFYPRVLWGWGWQADFIREGWKDQGKEEMRRLLPDSSQLVLQYRLGEGLVTIKNGMREMVRKNGKLQHLQNTSESEVFKMLYPYRESIPPGWEMKEWLSP
ncbi:hypothetical protein A3J36_02955 [Candidatus Uhrbacteria bacterium RIFCSPLOWO2_02_FULL_54_37]|uniref:DUF4412 domain-containing protein n=2 Tax=Candidatus Uhriibacteriota TaxID=1752732 RepID=A0A1F7VGJ6_9BACT|nr:MAG: hypothetical protein A3B36_02745 [Candidatus Uhrbacteria bacterium RIFCSPLOWO2_01_FULL_55_36]OGL89561.1 MAG: hypothetical protein A3J36_02955 [Candidatus Uhrbacteria bacterium RIFCSPLOWO2_02_FULL_54_37]